MLSRVPAPFPGLHNLALSVCLNNRIFLERPFCKSFKGSDARLQRFFTRHLEDEPRLVRRD